MYSIIKGNVSPNCGYGNLFHNNNIYSCGTVIVLSNGFINIRDICFGLKVESQIACLTVAKFYDDPKLPAAVGAADLSQVVLSQLPIRMG